jgi:hypothetical protein
MFNSSNTQWIQEQLNQLLPGVVQRPYVGFARSLFRIDTEVQPYADSYTSRTETTPPETAEIVGYNSVLPLVGQFSNRTISSPVVPLAAAVEYTVQEVEVARSMGTSISDSKLGRAISSIYRAEDLYTFNGDSNQSVYGIGNHPQIGHYPLAANGNSNGFTNTSSWMGKSIDQILRDIADVRVLQAELAEQMGSPVADTLLLPSNTVADLKSRLRGNEGSISLWDILTSNLSGIMIAESSRMNALPIAHLNGNFSAALFYNFAESMSVVIPRDITVEDPQATDLKMRTPVHSRFGGIRVIYPESTALLVGI